VYFVVSDICAFFVRRFRRPWAQSPELLKDMETSYFLHNCRDCRHGVLRLLNI
jgi:hypothetical protein